MVLEFFSIPGALLNEIDKYACQQREREARNTYWIRCPNCGKQVVKRELIKKGCYVCNWQGTEDKIKPANQETRDRPNPYKTNCPRCGSRVITDQLQENGCYLCGWKAPKD